MKLIFAYLKQRRGIIALCVLFGVIHGSVMILYQLPIQAAAYPFALCAAAGAAALAVDYRRVKRQHRQLAAIRSVVDALTLAMPEPGDILTEDYQTIIRLLCQEQRKRDEKADLRYQDMMEYYTIWAHQIKTPIVSMKLHLENEDSALSRQLSLDLMRIEQYVEMVLMFLRLDSESTDYVIREYSLDAIVRQAVQKFAGEFIARKLKLCYEPLNCTVITDEKWLSFVVEQVISNALKYTPSGSVSIYMEAPKTLCIRDTGMGISAADLPRIFEKGYTGCQGRKQKTASGIGLYLCKRICKNLGHGISAESLPEQGTVIRVNLDQRILQVE